MKIDSDKQVSEALPEQIFQQLREQLQHLLHEQSESTGQHLIGKESTPQKNRFEILLYYLHTGSVPWQVANASAQEIAIALTETCRREWPQLLDYVLKYYERASFLFRLLQLISEEQFSSLIYALSDRIPRGVVQCITLLFHSEKTIFNRYAKIRLAAGVLSESIRWQKNTTNPSLIPVALDAVPPEEMHIFYDFISSLPADAASLFQQKKPDSSRDENDELVVLGTDGTVMADFLCSLDNGEGQTDKESGQSFPPLVPDYPIQSKLKEDVHPDSQRTRYTGEGQTDTGRVNSGKFGREVRQSFFPLVPDYSNQTKPEEHLFPLMVYHTGLILLHPFIARFFENTGIMETGEIQFSSFRLARAAALLHFLATGCEDVYEYELGFIKILLGVSPEFPLSICEGLVKSNDKEEAESLLQSVIRHWSVLKNTSVNGLRSSFLQRQALLHEDENGWKLHAERAPFDVLLDQLPWSISIIKLPWMKKALYTEW